MAFRIGRKHAQHTYPEPRAATTVPLARNSASGPDENQLILDTGTPVLWDPIENGAAASTAVPITPKSTGIIHVTGVITVATIAPTTVQLVVELQGVPTTVPSAEAMTVASGASVAIPFDVILGAGANGLPLIIGLMRVISIRLISTPDDDVASIIATSSTISIQEVMPVTG